jgi:hypothetical protein
MQKRKHVWEHQKTVFHNKSEQFKAASPFVQIKILGRSPQKRFSEKRTDELNG